MNSSSGDKSVHCPGKERGRTNVRMRVCLCMPEKKYEAREKGKERWRKSENESESERSQASTAATKRMKERTSECFACHVRVRVYVSECM